MVEPSGETSGHAGSVGARAIATAVCPNCGATNAEAYCPRCGQDQRSPIRSIRAWLAQVLEELFRVDGRLPRSLYHLVAHPGYLTAAWIEGRRARYVAPLRLYLLSAVLFFPLSAILTSGGFLADALTGFYDVSHEAGEALAAVPRVDAMIQQIMFLLVPAMAGLLHLMFDRRYYVEHLVMALHFYAAFFLLRSVLVVVNAVPLMQTHLPGFHLSDVMILTLMLGWLPWYLFRSFRRVYGVSRAGAVAATVGVMFVQSVLLFVVAVGLVTLLSRGWFS